MNLFGVVGSRSRSNRRQPPFSRSSEPATSSFMTSMKRSSMSSLMVTVTMTVIGAIPEAQANSGDALGGGSCSGGSEQRSAMAFKRQRD